MALFDWNKNGKEDRFDTMMDYQLYKASFGKEEEEDEYLNSDYFPDNYKATESSVSMDTALHYADSSLDTEKLLKRLVEMQKKMYDTYENFATQSGYRSEVTESQQMHKDFWLYSFAKQLEYSNLSKDNKGKLLQVLLDTFAIRNPMSAHEYYKYIAEDSRFAAYVNNCLETRPDKCGLFWILLSEMGGNEGERTEDTIGFTRDYIVFMEDMEQYLQKMFSGAGLGGNIHSYMTMVINSISDAIDDIENAMMACTDNIENPFYQ